MNKNKCLDLFEKYLLGEASSEEIESLCSFINNDPNLSEWLEEEIENSSSDIDVAIKMRMLDNIRSHTNYYVETVLENKKTSKKHYLRWIANIAAVLFPVFLVMSLYMYNKSDEIDYLTVAANLGEKASINLPDGSKVAINSASEITYSTAYNKNDRSLELVGEAYFEVESDPAKPFIVKCGEIKVKVLGTSFDINAYDDNNKISVVLNSGKVEFITPNETLTMKPNDRVIYDRTTKNTEVQNVNAKDYTEWRQNRLRFENETLETIVKTISRMHNTDIVFKDEKLAKLKFTGTIDNTSVQSALKALLLTAPMSYETEDGVVYLYENESKRQYFK